MQRRFGQKIEILVKEYLEQQGLILVFNNYQCRLGEIDLIMKDQDALVFIEVRYRTQAKFGDGVATVTKSKQNKIKRTAACYLQEQNLYDKIVCRFDIVAVSGYPDCKFDWIKDAFWDKW